MLSKRTGAVLVLAAVLLGSLKTDGMIWKPHLALLAQLTINSSGQSLQQRCATYETTLRQWYPADKQDTLSRDVLFQKVLNESTNELALSADDKRIVADILQCIELAPALAPASTLTPVGDQDTTAHSGEQQAQAEIPPKFHHDDILILAEENSDSREKPLQERCKQLDETLRLIFSLAIPELFDASTQDVFKAAIERLENEDPSVRDNVPVLVALKTCLENLLSVDDGRVVTAGSQKSERQPPEASTDRNENLMAEFQKVRLRLRNTGQNLYDKSETHPAITSNSNEMRNSVSSIASGDRATDSSAGNYHPEPTPQQPDPNTQSMLVQLRRAYEQLTRKHSRDEEQLRKLEANLEREKRLSAEREQAIALLNQRLREADTQCSCDTEKWKKIEQDLLEQQRLASEKDLLIDDLKEQLRRSEQELLELKDANALVQGGHDEGSQATNVGQPDFRYTILPDASAGDGQEEVEVGSLVRATEETLNDAMLESENFKLVLAHLLSQEQSPSEHQRANRVRLIGERMDRFQELLRGHLEALLRNIIAQKGHRSFNGSKTETRLRDEINESDSNSEIDGGKGTVMGSTTEEKKTHNAEADANKVYKKPEDIARRLEELMYSDELPAHRCEKYDGALNYPGEMTELMIKKLARSTRMTANSNPDLYNNLKRYVPMLRASIYEGARLAAENIENCLNKHEQGTRGAYNSQRNLHGSSPSSATQQQRVASHRARTEIPIVYNIGRSDEPEDIQVEEFYHFPSANWIPHRGFVYY